MKEETRYRYEKRIEQLRREVDSLREYRNVCYRIFTNTCDQIHEGKTLSMGWLLKQFWSVCK